MTGESHANHAAPERPSVWVERWAGRVRSGGTVLDVACGTGRHARFFASHGCTVEAVDRDAAALVVKHAIVGVTFTCADIEGGPWPYAGRRFDAVVVTNYLFRPLLPALVDAVAPGGVLMYETFAVGNERYGRPTNPDFLLRPGELLEAVRGQLNVLAFESVVVDSPKPAMVQRICAIRPV